MSEDNNYGVPVEYVGESKAYTTEAEKAQIIANAMGQEAAEEAVSPAKEPEGSLPEKEVESLEAEKEEPKPEQNDEFASKFAALSRKEKAVREQEQALETKLAEIEQRQKEIDEQYGKYKDLSSRIKERPLDVLQENDLDFETLTRMVLENDGKPTPEMQIQQLRSEIENKYSKEVENLRKELEEKEKSAEEKRHQEVIENYKSELNEYIESNSENYELIKLNEASDLVYEVIEEHYNETGRILSNEEACQHVEDYLLEEAKKHLNVNKIKSLLGQKETETPPPGSPQKAAVNTLSNTEAATVPNISSRNLSDEESKREAAKLIKWDA